MGLNSNQLPARPLYSVEHLVSIPSWLHTPPNPDFLDPVSMLPAEPVG